MRITLVSAAVVAFALLASTANATDWCNGNGQMIDVAGQAYVTMDCFWQACFFITGAIYAETNMEPGLQRGGSDLTFGEADWCQDSPDPDLFVSWY